MINRIFVCVLALFALVGVSAAQTPPAQPAQRYALVVGVSGYGSGIPALQGPKNDASMITTLLREQGVPRANIRLLADQMNTAVRPIAVDGDPTRAAILEGFRWLAERAGPDVEIMIFMAGHGTQIRDGRPGEPDQLTEVFLPRDATARATQAATGAVSFAQARNMLTDDDIADALDPILARGARVWLVVDACHSGTLSRSAGDDSVARQVDPAIFGAAATTAAAASAPVRRPERLARFRGRDNLVAFYSAQPYQRAYESSQPRDDRARPPGPPQPSRKFGEMTWSLVQALRSGRSATYTSLGQRVAAGMWQISANRQTPMFAGALNARPMLGAGDQQVLALVVRSGDLLLNAGWIEDITLGSTYDIVDSNDHARVYGRATVSQVGATTSALTFAEPVDPLIERRDAQSVARLSARLRTRAVPFVLSVARPAMLPGVQATPADQELVTRAEQALRDLAGRPPNEQPIPFELALPNGAADFYPYVARGRLYFFAPGTPLQLPNEPGAAPYSLDASDVRPAAVADAIRVVGRARNLRRVAAAVADSDISRDLRVRLLTEPGDGRPATQTCADDAWDILNAPPARAVVRDFRSDPPVVRHCDIAYVEVTNTGPMTLNVGVMYVDPWGQIFPLVPEREVDPVPGVLRLARDERLVVSYREDLAPSHDPEFPQPVKAEGMMSLLVLAVPNVPDGENPTFNYLGQRHVRTTNRSVTTAFHALLSDAGLATTNASRNAGTAGRAERGGALIVPVMTQSRR